MYSYDIRQVRWLEPVSREDGSGWQDTGVRAVLGRNPH